MRMYEVMILPLAEEDIINNTDYIAFEKKAPETALELAMGFRNSIAKLEFMPRPHSYTHLTLPTIYTVYIAVGADG